MLISIVFLPFHIAIKKREREREKERERDCVAENLNQAMGSYHFQGDLSNSKVELR